MASLILGGGTRGGFLSDAILQFVSIPLLLVALWRLFDVPLTKQMRLALSFCAVIVLIPLVQLIPLPPGLWTALPNREVSVETFKLLNAQVPWMPLSVSPRETWLSALSLIPPVGIFIATVLLSYRARRWLSLVFLAVGVISVFLGLLQVAQGQQSALRFFAFTNWNEAVGFFANRNHFAALIYALILFAAAWAIQAVASSWEERRRRRYDTASIAAIIVAFTLLVVLLAGETMARSRFGLALTTIALLGAFALGVSKQLMGSRTTPGSKLIFAACALVVLFSLQFALYRIMERFTVDPLQDARLPFARNTIEAAIAYMPLGSGLGTFVPVYAMFEKPQDALIDIYVNHAHNDVLELWLNTGIVGLALAGMFVMWLALRSVEIWRRSPDYASELDWNLARAATMVAALLIAHSFFDYPLRTGAIMAVMAFACALLIEPAVTEPEIGRELWPAAKRTRHRPKLENASLQKPASLTSPSSLASSGARSLPTEQRWGADAGWPEEWNKPLAPHPSRAKNKPSNVPAPPKKK